MTCFEFLIGNISLKEEKYQDRIEDLEDNVRRLERMTTGEGASQEYLKNVVLNYMLRLILILLIANY